MTNWMPVRKTVAVFIPQFLVQKIATMASVQVIWTILMLFTFKFESILFHNNLKY